MSQGYKKYSQAYQKAAVSTLDQRKLIVMLYDGAIKFLSIASVKANQSDYFEAHTNLVKGKSIIAELLASLNMDEGGEIAANLQRLYAYMFNELIDANLEKSSGRTDRVIALLKELRDAWREVETPKSSPTPASGQGGSQGRNKRINLQG